MTIFAPPALDLDANLVKCLDIRQRAAVEDRKLEVVQFDDDVVDAGADAGRKKMLRGRNQDALAHQTGGVRDLGDVFTDRSDLEVIEIGAAKHDARSRRGREKPYLN